MNTLSLVDIFFLVTGSAVIIITVLVVIGLLYVIMFVRTAKKIAQTAHRATEGISEDITAMRNNIKEKGVGLSTIVDLAKHFGSKKINRKK